MFFAFFFSFFCELLIEAETSQSPNNYIDKKNKIVWMWKIAILSDECHKYQQEIDVVKSCKKCFSYYYLKEVQIIFTDRCNETVDTILNFGISCNTTFFSEGARLVS